MGNPINCQAIKAFDASMPSGAYTIYPNGSPVTTYCDMTSDNGAAWTMVYKIGGNSNMQTTGATNTETLGTYTLTDGGDGKMSDTDIKTLCTGQYKVVNADSGGGLSKYTPLYCKFNDINQYADNVVNTNKRCSLSYSSNAAYTGSGFSDHWSWGFSTWGGMAGATILQLNYRDGRLGSHVSYSSPSHGNCGGNGNCHSRVFCRK